MKKLIYPILFALMITTVVFTQEKKIDVDYRLILDFNAYPYFYEFTNKMNSNAFNGSIFFGAKLKEFTVGGEVFENLTSLNSQDKSLNYQGAWNILGSAADFFYQPISWFELKTGLGGSWYNSAFSKSDVGTYGKTLGGLTFLLDGTFNLPFEYINLSVMNRLDLIFSASYANPLYTGKIRVNFHPYFNWINLYLEAGVMTINYNGLPNNINSAAFVWGTGISFDLIMPSMFKYTKEKVQVKKKSKPVEIEEEKEPEIKKEEPVIKKEEQEIEVKKEEPEKEETKIEELKTVKQGESVTFTDIIFYPDSDRIKAGSYSELDKIADALKERSNITVEIIGHTNDTNKPELELALSKKRAETVRNYLIKKGIDPERMKAAGYGSRFTKKATIDEANRKVEIKILEVK